MSDLRSDAWKILSQTALPTYAVVQLYDADDKIIYLSSGPVTLEGIDYLPLLLQIPARQQGIDWFTREFTVSNATLEVINSPFEGGTRFSDLLDDKNFENRTADVRLWKPGITTWADCLPRFTGANVVTTPESEGLVLLSLEDSTATDLAATRLDRVTQADATTGYALPDESLGAVKPRMCGNHIYPINASQINGLAASSWVGSRVNNLTPMRDLGGGEWEVSAKQLASLVADSGSIADGTGFWAWDPDVKQYVEVVNWERVQNTANGAIIKVLSNEYYDYRLPFTAVAAGGGTDWANIARLFDRSIATASSPNVAAGVDSYDVDIDFPENTIDTADVSAIKLFIKGDFTALPDGEMYVDFGGTAKAFSNSSLTTHFHTHAGDIAFANIDKVALTYDNNSGTPTARVYETYLRVTYTNTKKLDLFSGTTGEAYTTAYDLANRPNNADTAETGNAINNFMGAFEWYLRTVLNLTNINTASLDTASNLVAGLLPSISVSEQEDPLARVFALAQNFKTLAWWDEANEFTVQVIEDDYISPDVVIDGRLLSDRAYGRSDERQVYGQVSVLYAGSEKGGRGETDPITDATALTWNNLSAEQSDLPFESMAYYGEATAEAMRDHLNELFKLGKNKIVGNLPEPFAYLGIGAVLGFEDLPVDLRDEDLSASYVIGGQTFRPTFIILRTVTTDRVTFDTVQGVKLVL